MFVCMDAYPDMLRVILASERKPKWNPVTVEIYKERRRIFKKVIRLRRVCSVSDSLARFFHNIRRFLKLEKKRYPSFIPLYQAAVNVKADLSGCFDCAVKITNIAGKELEIRSFMTQGTQQENRS